MSKSAQVLNSFNPTWVNVQLEEPTCQRKALFSAPTRGQTRTASQAGFALWVVSLAPTGSKLCLSMRDALSGLLAGHASSVTSDVMSLIGRTMSLGVSRENVKSHPPSTPIIWNVESLRTMSNRTSPIWYLNDVSSGPFLGPFSIQTNCSASSLTSVSGIHPGYSQVTFRYQILCGTCSCCLVLFSGFFKALRPWPSSSATTLRVSSRLR